MKKLCIVLLLLWSWSFIHAQNFNQLDDFIDLLNQNDKFMGSLSISKEGKTIYNKSVGYQYINERESKPIEVDSKFRIGSITKTFTAVLIFQLIDEGKLNIETKLSQYFPQIPNANRITIANLLNHSSGLFNITADNNFNEKLPTTQSIMLSLMASHQVDFQPGEKHEYSNTNFVVLGYIIEKIENSSYKSILKKRIANPLELKNTYYGDVINTDNNECLSYYYEGDASLHEANQAHLSNPGGAGGIVSNPSDLNVFINALFNDKLISKKSFELMTTIEDEYGSGIFSAEKEGLTIFAHNGTIDSFKSMLVYIPEFKTAIAFNANALDYGMIPIIFNAMAVLQGKEITIPSFGTIQLSETQLKQYTGTYECADLPFNLVFETDGKVLKGAPEGSDLKVLNPTREHEFTLETLGVVLNFDLESRSLRFKQSGETPKKCTEKS